MAYAVNPTLALVLRGYVLGESNQGLLLFTQDYGLIRAKAQSGKAVYSKMQPYFTSFTLAKFSLVRGKTGWLVTGAQEGMLSLGDISQHKRFVDRLASLLRLLPGGQPQPKIFLDVLNIYRLLKTGVENHEALELQFVSRFLHHLGYWPEDVAIEFLHQDLVVTGAMQDDQVVSVKKEVVPQINVGLAALVS